MCIGFLFWWCGWPFVGASIIEEDAGLEHHVAMSSTFAVIVITRQRYFLFSPFCVSSQKPCLFASIWCGYVLFPSLEHAEQPFWSARTRPPGRSTCKDNLMSHLMFIFHTAWAIVPLTWDDGNMVFAFWCCFRLFVQFVTQSSQCVSNIHSQFD